MNDLSFISKKDNKKVKNKNITKPKFWTEEEDKILKEKAEEFKYKNWNTIATFIPGKTSIQCSARYRRIRPGLVKGAWNKDEDNKLLSLYDKYGKNWAAISKEMTQRTGKQIRDRFLNSLDSKFNRGKFSEEEDQAIIKYYKIYGNSWAKIAKKLKTRTGDMVKNRFYSSLKKTIYKNKYLLKKKRERKSNKNTNQNQNETINQKHIFNNTNNLIEPKNIIPSTQESTEKMEKNETTNFIYSIKDSIKENDDISNQRNKINNNNSTNIISYDSNNHSIDNFENENNNIFCKNNSINSSSDYNDNENIHDRNLLNNNENENDNKIVENNNNIDYKLEPNLKKEEIVNYPMFAEDFGINSDAYMELNNNLIIVNQKDEVDERLERLKNYQIDYKQNLKEQLDIIFDLENIINKKLFTVQKELEKN